ncbi:ODV-E25 [Lonomia obliqua multiple nucleopolyhedrovirus]|uniref:ODV-E25 n=1 Tax=Lonomia obliqua multiple nucleopolyhedrovirus TaxID=134394 RepID=A0A126FCB5_9ABAC|nr:ODV-E25 [Lonomia obliqua multiple nucleopolyhedrovirus]AKN81042.1 ODV-E25 [Lonomia obliqua multiple nucleopolyhedrovirus]
MWGLAFIIIIAVVVYLWWAGKLNLGSLNDSSPSLTQSSDSVQVDPETNQLNVKLSNNKVSYVRIAHSDNKVTQVYIADKPLSFNEIIDESKNRVGTNCVFVGTVLDNGLRSPRTSTSASTSSSLITTKTTANFDIKEFKSMFMVFKNLTPSKMSETENTLRYEVESLTLCLIDTNATTMPELRDISYPILIYTKNQIAQQKLLEWNYIPINNEQSAYLKNHKSYREMN